MRAEMRMAEAVDEGQESGGIQRHGKVDVQSPDITLDEIGISRQRLSEWRDLRDAGEEVVEMAIQDQLSQGKARSLAAVFWEKDKLSVSRF